MKSTRPILVVLLAALATRLVAQSPNPELVRQLGDQLAEQLKRTGNCETLRQSRDYPNTVVPDSQAYVVKLQEGIEVVTEIHSEGDVLTRKDYFLHQSRVYAHRVTHHETSADGRTKRVAQSRFFFDKGAPIHRGNVTARVPLADKDPDLSKAREHEVPLPPGLEGWGDRLTARAFDIARTFRAGVGRYAFGNWDGWLLKDAPPAGSSETPPRGKDWRPPADTFVLPIPMTRSPDGIFAIGWGYEKGPVDWTRLASDHADEDFGAVYFTTHLATGELKAPLNEDSNFLLNANTGKPLGNLGLYHGGERQRFNHDEIAVHWSPSSTCFVVRERAKWEDAAAGIGWIKDGRCDATHDILKPLRDAANAAAMKSKHPAAKRLRADGEGFAFSVIHLLVEDDGRVEAHVTGQIPKDDSPGAVYEALVEGTFSTVTGDAPALLKTSKVTVLPQKPRD